MKELIAHLYGLADGSIQPLDKEGGLFEELYVVFGVDITEEVVTYFPTWIKFSGSTGYPVPHPSLDPRDAFWSVWNLWGDHEYGDNRRDLCRHCAQQLELKYGKGE